MVESIVKGAKQSKLENERRKLTIFFSDIRNFTDRTESREVEELSILLNNYLTEMTTIADKWGGTIDKVIGDAIMKFYGAPEETPENENALNCVKMAVEMQKKMVEMTVSGLSAGSVAPVNRIAMSLNMPAAMVAVSPFECLSKISAAARLKFGLSDPTFTAHSARWHAILNSPASASAVALRINCSASPARRPISCACTTSGAGFR